MDQPLIVADGLIFALSKKGDLVLAEAETFTDHDELEPELISDTLKENVEMKLYTDVNL